MPNKFYFYLQSWPALGNLFACSGLVNLAHMLLATNYACSRLVRAQVLMATYAHLLIAWGLSRWKWNSVSAGCSYKPRPMPMATSYACSRLEAY